MSLFPLVGAKAPPIGQAPPEDSGGPILPHRARLGGVVVVAADEPPGVAVGERMALLVLCLEFPLLILGAEVEVHVRAAADRLDQQPRAGEFVLAAYFGQFHPQEAGAALDDVF